MLQNVSVKDYMSPNVTVLTPSTPVIEALMTLVNNRITSAPVMDNQGKVVGIFSEIEGMKVAIKVSYNQDMGGGVVSDFMSKEVYTLESNTGIVELAGKLSESGVRSFLVMDGVDLVGIISRHDVMRAILSISQTTQF
ncbi:MAG: CBS domain-containing protein [Gammaproteobacteria bacterium]|nr:CBS domain-containing protein [Gammaproteobacteria bacterium]